MQLLYSKHYLPRLPRVRRMSALSEQLELMRTSSPPLLNALVHVFLVLVLVHSPSRPLRALRGCTQLCAPLIMVSLLVRLRSAEAVGAVCQRSPVVPWDMEQLLLQTLAALLCLRFPCKPERHAARWCAVVGVGLLPNVLRLASLSGGWCSVRALCQPCVVWALAPIAVQLRGRLDSRPSAKTAEVEALLDHEDFVEHIPDNSPAFLRSWQLGALDFSWR